MHQDVTHFERSQAYADKMVGYGADTWTVEEPKSNFTYLQNLHISTPSEKKLHTGSRRKRRRTTLGFLLKCQPPACAGNPVPTTDRSGRQCQAEKTEQHSIIATLPTVKVEVTRTERRGQHEIVVAIEKVHPGGLEEWVFISDEPVEGPSTAEVSLTQNRYHSEDIPVTPRVATTAKPSWTVYKMGTTCTKQ